MGRLIGIFGGTFDPPHLGHLILASEAQYQLGLSKVLWVLTPDPPHKRGKYISPIDVRREMLEAAMHDAVNFSLSTVDIDRPGPHYALDTVLILQEQHPEADLVYLMGGDSLQDLNNWYDPASFVAKVHALGVMRRPGDKIDLAAVEASLPGVREKVRFVDAPLLEVASSEIRKRAASGAPIKYYLPAPVFQVIQKHGLYTAD